MAAAADRFHQLGYARTSLADVARAAGMSAGNVFYYFKAKDDLAKAVIDEWCRRLAEFTAPFETESDGWGRLKRFVEQAGVLRDMYVTLGCPLASLSRDLRREAEPLQAEIPRIYDVQHQWVRTQFAGLGFQAEEAEQHARFLTAALHGAIHLAHANNDDTLILSAIISLKLWLERIRTS